MGAREERQARNESLFREVNERIEEATSRIGVLSTAEFLCECADAGCVERIELSMGEYEKLRSHPAHFAVRPGHEYLNVDRVIEQRDDYVIVEKHGEAREIAERRDPRS